MSEQNEQDIAQDEDVPEVEGHRRASHGRNEDDEPEVEGHMRINHKKAGPSARA